MTIPVEVYIEILRFNSHLVADIIRPCIIESGFGRFLRVNSKICWLMTNSNKDNDNSYETYVLGKVLKHKYQVKYISHIVFTDKIYYHINRDHLKKLYEQDEVIKMAYDEETDSSDNDTPSSDEEELLLHNFDGRLLDSIIDVYES